MTRRTLRGLTALLCLLAGGVLLTVPAWADSSPNVRIRQADLDQSGSVRLVVSAGGAAGEAPLTAADIAVTEQGQPVQGMDVQPYFDSTSHQAAVALLIDVSGSMVGKPLEDAKAAAHQFLASLPPSVSVALFSFAGSVDLRAPFTAQRPVVDAALDGLVARGETAIYDAVRTASMAIQPMPGQHDIVLFTDGGDTVSKSSHDEALSAAKQANALVSAVGLVTPDFNGPALDALTAPLGGRVIPVGQSAALSSAFAQVANDIASQYVVTYRSNRLQPKELDLAVKVTAQGGSGIDRITVANPRVASPAGPAALVPVPAGGTGLLASRQWLAVGLVAMFVSLALFLFLALHRPGERKALRLLRTSIKSVDAGPNPQGRQGLKWLTTRAIKLVERVPRPKGLEASVQLMLDRSEWSLTISEVLLLQILAVFGASIVAHVLLHNWAFDLLLAVLGGMTPWLVLNIAADRRISTFTTQLPETLQLLAGSMRAGFGLVQALDTVVKELDPPTSTQFSRVLAEARLGVPMSDALTRMAARVGSEDFRWVVLAIEVQTQVGGNLAQLLETVAETIRHREQLRRHVQALSAEGRLSAWILGLLPFVLSIYMALVNRTYFGALLNAGIGRFMILGAVILMAFGAIWMRRIVRIEV